MAYNKNNQLKKNIDAITLALQIKAEGRTEISSEEYNTISSYSGFGGLKCILYPAEKESDIAFWISSEKINFNAIYKLHRAIRSYSDTAQIYDRYIASLKMSVKTAIYTPNFLPEKIGKVLLENRIHIKTILDPSIGMGAFPKELMKTYPGATVESYEKDILSAMMIKTQHPEYNTINDGFEKIDLNKESSYDLITSNIPFGDFSVYDPSFKGGKDEEKSLSCSKIHNYFFMKGNDYVRKGGVIAFITSSYFMNAPSNTIFRERLMKDCSLVSAIRLPDKVFIDTSGVEVSSDLIILQKRDRVEALTLQEKQFITTNKMENIQINDYFSKNPEQIICTSTKVSTDQFGKPTFQNIWDGDINLSAIELERILSKDVSQNIRLELFNNYSNKEANKIDEYKGQALTLFDLWDMPAPTLTKKIKTKSKIDKIFPEEENKYIIRTWLKEEEFYKDGWLALDKEQIGYVAQKEKMFKPLELSDSDFNIASNYIKLRDAYYNLFIQEKETNREQKELREILNKAYDSFVYEHGFLIDKKASAIITLDQGGLSISALERPINGRIEKSSIFFEPVTFKIQEQKQFTSEEGLASSINIFGKVDFSYISDLSKKDGEQVRKDLIGKIYYNPLQKEFQITEEIIKGDVIFKKEQFQDILNQYPDINLKKEIQITIDALDQATPNPISFSDLEFNFGERWIPEKLYTLFASDLMNTSVQISYFASSDNFIIKADSRNADIWDKWSVRGERKTYDGLALLQFALTDNVPDIYKTIYKNGGNERIIDSEKTQLLASKVESIQNEFNRWLSEQPQTVKQNLTDLYNKRFNCFVRPQYDGMHQTFPDLNMSNFGYSDLYSSQKNAIWMLKINNGGIVDHEVGGGKTLIMCAAAYEMKRLGMAHKPMIIGLKANTAEIARTFKLAYPNAKILFPTAAQFEKKERHKLFAEIKNNNWDCVILTHDQFMRIEQSPEIEQQVLQEELNDVEENLKIALDGKISNNRLMKGLETRQENLINKLLYLRDKIQSKKDIGGVPDFGDMGIDHLFVDESHSFKNLMFNTRHQRVAGLGNTAGSQKATNLLFAIRTIQNRRGEDLGATFLSGTTVSNSLTELYLLFKYLRPRALARQKITCFDSWAAIYTKKTRDYEFNVVNQLIAKERFRYFIKVPELAMFYSEITDYKTAKDIGVIRPEIVEILKNDSQTPQQEKYSKVLMDYARTGDNALIGRIDSDNNNKAKMLIATNLSRKMSLDMRLIDPLLEDNERSKLSQAAEKINMYYHKYQEDKGTQFVFTDLGAWKKGEWTVCGDLKQKLVEEYNIPEDEIRFIQEFTTDKRKEKAIKEMNDGNIRVMIGGTNNLGTGVNAQKRCVAIHHLEIPWKPSELDQRNGRGVRPGNVVAMKHGGKLDVVIYATEKTLDVYRFNLLKNKQTFIFQLKSQNLSSRRIDEGSFDENNGMNMAEYIAVLSGNTDLLENIKLEKKIMSLEGEKRAFYRDKETSLINLNNLKVNVNDKFTQIESMQKDYDSYVLLKSKDTNLDNKEYTPIILAGKSEMTATDTGMYLNKLAVQIDTKTEYQKVGTVYGFPILIKTNDSKENRFFVCGKFKYTFNNGMLARDPLKACANPIGALDRLPTIITNLEEVNKRDVDLITQLERSSNRFWDKEDVLEDFKIRKKEIEIKIQKSIESQGTDQDNNKEVINENSYSVKSSL